MFLYPNHALVQRSLPKSKVYANARPTRTVRDRFVSQVAEIVWHYKLSPDTIRLPARSGVEEIQVFEIALKTPELGEEVLRTIDRAIPSLLFFELTFQGRVRFAAAYKRMSEVGTNRPVVDMYFETPWQDAAAARKPLPVALDLANLYDQMLRQLMLASPLAVQSRASESLAKVVERSGSIRAKLRECQKLELQLRKEVQFNRKVEINTALRTCRTELLELQTVD
jgi:Domain of unknown function (DUF4391)